MIDTFVGVINGFTEDESDIITNVHFGSIYVKCDGQPSVPRNSKDSLSLYFLGNFGSRLMVVSKSPGVVIILSKNNLFKHSL